MKDIKSYFKDVLFLINLIDFAVIYIALFLTMYLLNYHFTIAMCVSYVYTAFYYVIKRVIVGLPISFAMIFAIFIGGIVLLPGSIFMLLHLFA